MKPLPYETPGIAKIKGLRGDELIREYRRIIGDTTLLAFSRGKDSVATALALRDKINIVPFTYYYVPDMPMVEESLDYFERTLFKRRILRFPHSGLYHWLDLGCFQPLINFDIYEASELAEPAHNMAEWGNQIRKWIIEDEKISCDALIAIGVMASDSPNRWLSFQKHGAIRQSSGAWYPIWQYSRDHLLGEIARADIKLPIDYHLFGKSFDGIHYQYLVPLKRHRPQDYQKILEWFPEAEVEVWRYEKAIGTKD